MAGPYHGKDGLISYCGSAVASITSWSFSTSIDIAGTTAMGSTNSWETQRAGLSDFSGSCEALANSGASLFPIDGSDGSLEFFFSNSDATVGFEGNAIGTGITETVSQDDVGKVSVSFEGNDAAGLAVGDITDDVILATPFHGKRGGVVWNSEEMPSTNEWSISLTCDTADSTSMDMANYGRTRLAGFKAATASWSCLARSDGFATQAGTAIALGDSKTLALSRNLSDSATGYYTGTARITGMDMSNDARGITTATYNAKFDGKVTFATA